MGGCGAGKLQSLYTAPHIQPSSLHTDRQTRSEKQWKVSPVPKTGDPAQVSDPTHHPTTHQPVPLGLSLQTLHPTLPTDGPGNISWTDKNPS